MGVAERVVAAAAAAAEEEPGLTTEQEGTVSAVVAVVDMQSLCCRQAWRHRHKPDR